MINTNGNYGIGISPTARLHVSGQGSTYSVVRFETGNEGVGKILSSDSSGNGDWVDITSLSGLVDGVGTTNYAIKWTNGLNSSIGDGTWAFSGNTYYPVTDNSNIGLSGSNRVGTIFLSSNIDFANDLNFISVGVPKHVFKTDGSILVNGATSSTGSTFTIKVNTTGSLASWNFGNSTHFPTLGLPCIYTNNVVPSNTNWLIRGDGLNDAAINAPGAASSVRFYVANNTKMYIYSNRAILADIPLYGSDASGGNLTLASTSSGGSKGFVYLGSSTGVLYDETNNRLGIGLSSSDTKFVIKGVGTTSSTFGIKHFQSDGVTVAYSSSDAGDVVIKNSITIGNMSYTTAANYGVLSLNGSGGAEIDFKTGGVTQFGIYNVGSSSLRIFGGVTDLFILNSGSAVFNAQLRIGNAGNTGMRFDMLQGTSVISMGASTNVGLAATGTSVIHMAPTPSDTNYVIRHTPLADTVINGITLVDLSISGVSKVSVTSSGMGIGLSSSLDNTAKLQVDSTTQGVLFPRMTLSQRTSIVTPAVGLVVYQTDTTEGLYVNTSGGWIQL